MITRISDTENFVTLVNVFYVEPENQQKLVDVLVKATETVMKHLPGFISANIHQSLDGTRIVNYAQWRSKEDFEAIFQNPDVLPHFKEALGLSVSENDGHLYKVVCVENMET